jgi:hypothetical protein
MIRPQTWEHMNAARKSLGDLHIDQKQMQEELRRSMEAARKAVQEALRNVTNVDSALAPARKALAELARSQVATENQATVTVRNSANGVKSLVKADDSGTIVLVNHPKLHLTAHDKEGRLVFDGEIDSPEQRAQVPRDLWERVEPLLDKMGTQPAEPEEAR